ncbi:M15 family metallopeptidase [Arthrobacter sp. UYP6]|uniref:M15 family metallopeptidase n=1 Tax=Arthrobacter sp. UYP6 TaxID=1756378 RepID=UPI00339AB69C
MTSVVSLAARERRTQRVRNVAVAALCSALLGAYLLAFGLPDGLPRAGGGAFSQQAMAGPAGVPAAGSLTDDDGVISGVVSVFDDAHPAVSTLDPVLLDAVRAAAVDAAAEGIAVVVISGWRSPQYQERLLEDAVARYGSKEEAARWVATAETSAHVRGGAVDVGPDAALEWLSANGAGYGLCQVYGNEPWHFGYLPDAVTYGCPAMYTDPTEDPRMNPP